MTTDDLRYGGRLAIVGREYGDSMRVDRGSLKRSVINCVLRAELLPSDTRASSQRSTADSSLVSV
jgi:hypothetical protein